MKKIISILLVLSLLFCFTACKDGENDGTSSSGKTENSNVASSDGDTDTHSEPLNYTKFDDLPGSERIRYHEVYFSTPSWRSKNTSNGFTISDSNDYSLVVAYDAENEYSGDMDGINEYMQDKYINTLYDFYVAEYQNISYESKDTVTLDCGSQALRFKGTLTAESGGNTRIMPIYGYNFTYDGATIAITYVIKSDDKAAEYEATLKDIVDKMVKTIRTQP